MILKVCLWKRIPYCLHAQPKFQICHFEIIFIYHQLKWSLCDNQSIKLKVNYNIKTQLCGKYLSALFCFKSYISHFNFNLLKKNHFKYLCTCFCDFHKGFKDAVHNRYSTHFSNTRLFKTKNIPLKLFFKISSFLHFVQYIV